MGQLVYGAGLSYDFEDRVLAHLRAVIVSKLLLQESFLLSWETNGRQQSLWMNPAVAAAFHFDESPTPPLNHDWLNLLMTQANSPGGLRVTPEPLNE